MNYFGEFPLWHSGLGIVLQQLRSLWVAQIQPLAQELPYAAGAAIKKKYFGQKLYKSRILDDAGIEERNRPHLLNTSSALCYLLSLC